MTQSEKRSYLLRALLAEEKQYRDIQIPRSEMQQKQLLRALFNVRRPKGIGQEFLDIQDAYLQSELSQMGITDYKTLTPIEDGIYLWQGDITTLRCDAIVNAANSGMTGCYVPNHACIDNCIHTFAGVQLRYECGRIMQAQGYEEPTGKAKITPGYNLPAKYVLHTVGPIIQDVVTKEDEELLASCYRSCLELAAEHQLESVAFCCISTGVFRFPNHRAAEIAVDTVRKFRANSNIEVIFNVFKDFDYQIYRQLLG